MDETPELIRHQINKTTVQLSEKLESLESQVSQSVQSASSAVNATVESVRQAVETVTDVIQGAAKSCSNALDVQRQVDKHPWLIVGGAVVVGYLAAEFLAKPTKDSGHSLERVPLPRPTADKSAHQQDSPRMLGSGGAPDKVNSFWQQISRAAIGPLMEMVQDAAARAAPLVVDYLAGNRTNEQNSRPAVPLKTETPEGANGQRKQLDAV